jgi:hypothetical protein
MSLSPAPLPSVSEIPKAITTWLSEIVEISHKQFAFVWGALATTGVVGVPAGAKLGGGALLVYSVLAHLAENLFQKSAVKSSPVPTPAPPKA